MKPDNHQRVRKLLIEARVEGISGSDRDWLNAHLAHCSDCSREAQTLASTIQSLRELPGTASAALVRRTSLAVRRRAAELQAERTTAIPLWIAAALSTVCVVVTAPYVWSAFAWIGRLSHLPQIAWQIGFLMWWFMPATVIGAVAVWRKTLTPAADPYWTAETNWEHI